LPSDWDAASYDRISDPQAGWAIPVVERIDGAPDTIMDAGCGTGRVTELLLQRFPGAHVVGVDVSASMLSEARRRLEPFGDRVTFVQSNLLEPIEAVGGVDAIFSNAVFHWIHHHDTLFANLAALLRPGGQLVAQWGGSGNITRLLDVLDALDAPSPPPPNFATAEQTQGRLEAAGFQDVRTWMHPAPAEFETREAFEEFLRTVCLRCHLDLVGAKEADAFVRSVADRMPDRTIDYVRLNADARRSG
jgi:trans-aconitate 2-methyltransferase